MDERLQEINRVTAPVMDDILELRQVSGSLNGEVSRMQDNIFPQEHSARRVVIILPENDRDECRYDLPLEERKFLDDHESFVMSYPFAVGKLENKALQNIVDADLIRPGAVLVQSPYDRDTYVNLIQAAELFAVEKLRYFSRLCQYLGACDVTVEQVEVSKDSKSKVYSLQANAPAGSVDGKFEDLDQGKLARKFAINTVFKGGKPNIVAAESYLRSKQLWGDVVMRSLIEQCSDEDNKILEQRVTISLSSESKLSFGVVARLKLPVQNIGVEANYLNAIDSIEEYRLTLNVRFNDSASQMDR